MCDEKNKRWMGKRLDAAQRKKFSFGCACLLAVLTAWRMSLAFFSQNETLFAESAFSIVLTVALFLLYRNAFAIQDRRLRCVSYSVGLFFSACTLIGGQVRREGAFGDFSWGGLFEQLFLLMLLGIAYGAALTLVYQAMQRLQERRGVAETTKRESLFSRLSGNWLILFLFFMICWIPAWLAFWPGCFSYDSITQFYTYLDNMHNSHHPLLHTQMLGFFMLLGIDNDPNGIANTGLALYSAVQMVLTAAIVAYGCRWLRQRKTPVVLRISVVLLFGLLPFYGLWTFNAQKDILFGGLVLLFLMELADLWREPERVLKSPLRIVKFALITILMLLFRNNGIYALVLLMPFAIGWAKKARLRTTGLLAGCMVAYFAANAALIAVTEATVPSQIEILSIPLQQIARTLRDNPQAIEQDTDGVIETLYEVNPGDIYHPAIADPVKWTADSSYIDEMLPQLFSLWGRLGLQYPKAYLEAFFVQNAPYYLPGAEMLYHIDPIVVQMDYFPIEEHSYLPELRSLYGEYDKSLTYLGLPLIRLLSDTAFQVWICIALLGYAVYKKQRKWMVCLTFLLAIWFTCLLGPVALIRYMLGFFYSIPVLGAAMVAPEEKTPSGGEAEISEVLTECVSKEEMA